MRIKLDQARETQLQSPILDALDDYFDAAYVDSPYGSVGTGAPSRNEGMTVMFSAFRVPDNMVPVVRQFLEDQGKLFASKLTVDDRSKTKH